MDERRIADDVMSSEYDHIPDHFPYLLPILLFDEIFIQTFRIDVISDRQRIKTIPGDADRLFVDVDPKIGHVILCPSHPSAL